MLDIKNKIIIGFTILILSGIIIDFSRTTFDLESTKLKSFDEQGNVITIQKYDFPISYKLLGIASIFCYSLGFSIFITGFVTSKLEENLRKKEEKEFEEFHKIKQEELKELRDSINIDVFDSLFKTLVPEEIFKVVKHQIIENKIIRKDARWYFDFTIENSKLQLKQTLKYTLLNLSQQEVSKPVKIQTGTEQGVSSELLSAKYRTADKEIICYPREDESENEDEKKILINNIENKAYQKLIEYNIGIPANSSVEATTVLKHTYEKTNIQDQYITRYPIIDGTLVVSHPSDYNFKLFSAMSTQLKPDIIEENRKTYELKGAVLPYQSFVYFLEKEATTK